jgi:hypothetical protein
MRIAVSSNGAIVTVADANNKVFIYKITQASGSGVNTAVKVGTIDLSLDAGINIAQLAVYHRQDYAFIALSYNILPVESWPADNKPYMQAATPPDTLFYQCKYELYSFTATDDSNNLNFSETETASAAYTDTVVANVYTYRTVSTQDGIYSNRCNNDYTKLLWEPFQSIAIVNDGSVVIWANNRNVRVFDASDNTLIKELDHRFASVAVSNNMQYIAIGSWGTQTILDDRCIGNDITLSVTLKRVLIYQLSSIRDSDQPAPIDTFNVDERPRSLTFSDDDNRLVIGMITKFEVWGNNFSVQTPNSLVWEKHSELSIPDIAPTVMPSVNIFVDDPYLDRNNWILNDHVNAPGVYLTVVNQTDDIIGTLGHHNSLGGEKTRSYIVDTPVHDENKYKTISYNLVKDYEDDTETTLINYFKAADPFDANDLHYPAPYIIDKYDKTIDNLIHYGYATETDFPYNIVKDYQESLQNGIMTLFSAIQFDVKALGYPVLYIIEKLIDKHVMNSDDFLAYGYEAIEPELEYNNVKDYDGSLQNIIYALFLKTDYVNNPLDLKVLGYPVNYLLDKNFTAGALESRYGYEAADLLVQLTTSEKVTLRYTREQYTAQYFKDKDVSLDTVIMFQFTPGELFEAGYKMSDFTVRPSHKELLQYGFTLKDMYPELIDSLEWEDAIDTSIADISNPDLNLTGHALAANKQSIATIHERVTVGGWEYERDPNHIPIRVAVFDINDDRSALKQRGNVIEVKVGSTFTYGTDDYDTAYASWAMTGNIVISADGNIIAFATDYTKWDEGSLTSYGDIINVIHTYKYNEQNNTWNHHGNIIRSSNYTSMVMSALGDTIVLGGGVIDYSISAPVLVYKYDGASTWTKVATLTPPTETAEVINSYFGSKLSISPDGKNILVGASNEKRTDFPVEVRVPKELRFKGVYDIDIKENQPATVYGVVYTYNLNYDAWELDLDHDILAPSIKYFDESTWNRKLTSTGEYANRNMNFYTEYAESMCHGYKNIEMVGFNNAYGLNYLGNDAPVGFAIKGQYQYTSDETFKPGKNFVYGSHTDYYTFDIAANSACSHGLTSDGLVRIAATNGNHNGALFEFAYKGENTYPDIDVPHSLLVENAPLTGTFINNTVVDPNLTGFVNSLEQNADNMLLSVQYETPFGGGSTSIVYKLASEDDLSDAEITGGVSQDITISKMVVTISNIPTTLDNYLMYVVNEITAGSSRDPSTWNSSTNINGMFLSGTHDLFNLTSGEITTTINWTYDEAFIVIAKKIVDDDDDDIHIPIWYMPIQKASFNSLAYQWTKYPWPAYFNVHANSFGDRNAAGFQAPHAKTKELFKYEGYDRSNIGIGISANGALVVTTGDSNNTIAIYSESDPNFNETAVTALTKDDINALDKSFARKILKYLITKDPPVDLQSFGFTFNELFASDSYNLTPDEMILAGYTIQMGLVELTNEELRQGGFTASHYKDAGYNVNEAADAGFSLIELGSVFTVDEFKTAGISAADAFSAGFSYDEMITAGYGTSDFTASGISISDLHTSGVTYSKIKNAGFSAADFKADGVLVTGALDAGFTIPELLEGGYTDTELYDEGKTWVDIYPYLHTGDNLELDIATLNTLTKETIQAYDSRFQTEVISHMIDNSLDGEYIDLNTKGFTITELDGLLSSRSLTVTECKNVGYSLVHMSQSGIFLSIDIADAYNETSDIVNSVNIISLNGASELYINQGSTYHDAGATVITSNGTNTLYSTMTVDTTTVGQYQLLYSDQASGLEVLRIVNVITVPPVYNSDSSTNDGPYMVNDIFPVYTDQDSATDAGDESAVLQNIINHITYYVPNDAYVMNGTDDYDSTRVVKISVEKGWNLISYGKDVKLWKSQVWTGVIWEYDGSAYIQSSDISAEKGYWVNAKVSGDIYATIKK